MARIHRLTSILAVAGLLLPVAGCSASGAGVVIPLGFDDLGQCPLRSIAVDELRGIGEPGCDLVGSSLVFPDGVSLLISAVGDVDSFWDSSAGDHEHVVVNWGIPGVAAFTSDGARVIDLWGSSDEAEQLQREQATIEGLRLE